MSLLILLILVNHQTTVNHEDTTSLIRLTNARIDEIDKSLNQDTQLRLVLSEYDSDGFDIISSYDVFQNSLKVPITKIHPIFSRDIWLTLLDGKMQEYSTDLDKLMKSEVVEFSGTQSTKATQRAYDSARSHILATSIVHNKAYNFWQSNLGAEFLEHNVAALRRGIKITRFFVINSFVLNQGTGMVKEVLIKHAKIKKIFYNEYDIYVLPQTYSLVGAVDRVRNEHFDRAFFHFSNENMNIIPDLSLFDNSLSSIWDLDNNEYQSQRSRLSIRRVDSVASSRVFTALSGPRARPLANAGSIDFILSNVYHEFSQLSLAPQIINVTFLPPFDMTVYFADGAIRRRDIRSHLVLQILKNLSDVSLFYKGRIAPGNNHIIWPDGTEAEKDDLYSSM
ncbi:MAG: hypothetical protein AAGI52_13115 [Bacteroidota bacterium]